MFTWMLVRSPKTLRNLDLYLTILIDLLVGTSVESHAELDQDGLLRISGSGTQ